jgi:CubicO group peptidase (beta-lactamase class C family)
MLRTNGRIALTVLLLLTGAACYDAPTEPDGGELRRAIDVAQEWERATPAETGFDAAGLESAIAAAADVRSLLIVRDGYLVHESYGAGIDRNSMHDVRSVTKSIVSALVGIAIGDGLIAGTRQQIGDLLPASLALDGQKRAIQVHHLLTMTSGFEWLESGAIGYNDWISADDQVGFLLARRLDQPPGTVFNYNSAATHLLSVILARAAGEPLPQWSQRVFFDQIGIDRADWEPVSGGQVNGGSGLDLRATDLARIGQLFLQQGASGVRQIIPRDWVLASVAPRFSGFGVRAGIGAPNYGMLWWLDLDDAPAFFAWGFGGQFIYVVPSLYLVIVLTTEWRDPDGDASARSIDGLETISAIIEAAR